MTRASSVSPAGSYASPADSVTLDYDARFRRRMMLTCDSGKQVLLDLPQVTLLNDGDGLVCEDGAIIEVKAAPEKLAEITCSSEAELVRVAWHLGNRHLPTQLMDGKLRIREDHVIIDMVEKLGGKVALIEAPFNPEGGAYGHGRVHSHDHGPGHEHGHGHDHSHAHAHD